MGASQKNLRADTVIRNTFPHLSRRHVEEALEAEWVKHESGRALKKGEKLSRPSELDFGPLMERLELLSKGSDIPGVALVHETKEWVVIDKPAGVPSHPLRLRDTQTVTHWAFHHFPEARHEFSDVQPTLTPHRLDTGTSGLLIVARTLAAYEQWRTRFSGHEIEKRYLAWVWGVPEWEEEELVHRCGHSATDDRRMVVKGSKQKIRGEYLKAQMQVRKVAVNSDVNASLIEARCQTGVMHQVRVQLMAAGFPLVGDTLYDPKVRERSLQTPSHLLRAFFLKTPEGQWEIDTAAFRDFFNEIG